MFLTDAALKRRIVVLVLIVLIALVGTVSYLTLPREAAPDVPIPLILITTTYNGVSPTDIESSITMKIEKELSGLKGLREIRSTSAEGISFIQVEFQPDIIIEDALQYVRDRVDMAKPELPNDADEPAIREVNIADFPIMMITVSGTISPVRLKTIADELEDRFEQVSGVLNVEIIGALEREIRIEFDPARLAAYDLTMSELLQLIPAENVNISAGSLQTEGTRFGVRIPAEFVEPDEIDTLMLAVRDGVPIYLSDIAVVRDTFKDRESYSRVNGNDSITMTIQKRIGANIVDIADEIQAIVAEARLHVPEGVNLDVVFDNSKYIRLMVTDLENNIASGLILVLVVLLLFVGFRTSAIVAFAIPLSMLMSFALISMLGYTLNMIVLFSLVLSLGMLVDNAIVIVENIYRHMQLGYSRLTAAHMGAAEVAWPVATSTATTVAAFFPMLFWPGIVGDFMKYLPITVIITLSSSLFVALVISPTICSLFAKGEKKEEKPPGLFMRGYHKLLYTTFHYRLATLVIAATLLVGMGLLYAKVGLGVEFFPDADPERATINLRLPQGANIDETDRLARLVAERIEKYREHFDHVSVNVGNGGGFNPFAGSMGGPHTAEITMIFKDFEIREVPSTDIIADVRKMLADLSGVEVSVNYQSMGPPTGAPVTIRFIGEDYGVLGQLSDQAQRMIQNIPGLVNLTSDLEAARPELVFPPDRQRAMMLRTNTAAIGNFIKMAIFGQPVGTYREFDDEYDITVRLPEHERTDIESLLTLQLPNKTGNSVPLSSLGEFVYAPGLGTINRIDQKRVVTVTADVEGRLSPNVLRDVQTRLEELQIPSDYSIEYAGEKEEQDEAAAFLTQAFVLAVLIIIMILVMQFNSLTVPLIIIATVVLSLVGVLSGLIITGTPFGIIMTGIGVISLAGVVVNNAIVLLDYTRQLQRQGMELMQAALRAGETRLRPVLLTAATTILGLVPMATGVSYDFHIWEWATRSQSSEWWNSMAIAVIFGLAFATVLTLVVVPTLYVTVYKIAARHALGGLETKEIEEERPSAED